MRNSDDLSAELSDFTGVAKLFPLPNFVLFPHVAHPLHVFEARYLEMLQSALSGDQLLAMALLTSGWEKDYEQRPPIEPIVCLGRVLTYSQLPDGNYNILLAGLSRARVIEELPPSENWREASLELLDDNYSSSGVTDRPQLRCRLLDCFQKLISNSSEVQKQLEQLLSDEIPLGTITDIVGHTLDLDPAFKMELLSELNIDRRATRLLEYLEELADEGIEDSQRIFPPDFSLN